MFAYEIAMVVPVGLVFKARTLFVSLKSRLKGLHGPVSRVKKKKKFSLE